MEFPERLLDTDGAAQYLKLKPHTLRVQRHENRAPGNLGYRVGGAVRYDISDLDSYLDAQRQRARDEARDQRAAVR